MQLNENEMEEFASKIAKEQHKCILLCGDLGSGKTTFARAFIRALAGSEIMVASPTYNIVHIYEDLRLAHFDLYRLQATDELENIGFEEYLQKYICLIEWPEIAENLLPKQYLRINFSGDGDFREINLEKM